MTMFKFYNLSVEMRRNFVSLNNEDSRRKIFDSQNWPGGIRIRPLRVIDKKTITVKAAQNSSEHNLTSLSTTTGSVGRLCKDTTEDSLTKHLSHRNIKL